MDFEKELKKFKALLNVNEIEHQLATEDMRDLMDLVKDQMNPHAGKTVRQALRDREL